MEKNIFLGILITIACIKIHANDFKKNEDSVARQLFVKSEKIAIRNRAKTEKMRFLDPVERDILFYKIVRSESPDLLDYTNKYKFSLINLLIDKTIKKDDYSDFDIVNVLYNLCIDDYIKAMDSVYSLVKKNKLKFDILERMIIQDFNVSNQLANNYRNPKLQQFIYRLLQEIKSGDFIIPKKNYDFIESVNKLISGEELVKGLKEKEIIYPPLLNSKNCR